MKNYLAIHSGIYFVFAFGLFFIPNQIWPLYGMQINDSYAMFLSQHNSIFLGGIAFIGFFFRNVERESTAYLQLIKGLASTNLLGFIITLYAIFMGYFSGFGWSDPAFFLFLFILCMLEIKRTQKYLS